MRGQAPLAIALTLTITSPAAAITGTEVNQRLAVAKSQIFVNPMRVAIEADRIVVTAGGINDTRVRNVVMAGAYRLKAEAALRSSQLETAALAISASLQIIKRIGTTSNLAGEALLTQGGVHAMQGHAAAALLDYQQAFRIFQRRLDARSQAVALLYIANLYADARDYSAALRYINQAKELKSNDLRIGLSLINNAGNALHDMGKYREASKMLVSALAVARTLPEKPLQIRIMGNISRSLLYAGDDVGAERMLSRAKKLDQIEGDGVARPRLLAIAAEIALRRRHIVEAGHLINQSFAGVDLTTTTMINRDAHDTAYRIFLKLDQPRKALAHLMALKRLDDESTKLATSTSTALMSARFDFANQELRISKLRAEELRRNVAAEHARARLERAIFTLIGGATAAVIALLAWLLFTIRRSRDQISAANDGLAVTNAALGKALAAKMEFLATTSHEIRTPLNGILGMTQVMLADANLAVVTRERLEVVRAAGAAMRALVDDILDLAKMESGNLTVEQHPVDLCETLRAATLLWQGECQAKGLTFAADIDRCPGLVMGDAARVRQVVFNLLANAVKFTAKGGIRLVAETERASGRIFISVADTGIGIAPDKRDAIFEAFQQADTSTTRRFGGTGLGLSISRNLAVAMGGDVTVDSILGEGSTFTLTLPLIEVAAEATGGVGTGMETQASILVVDRSPIAQAMWRSLLAPSELLFAKSSDEACAMIANGRIAAVLVDDRTIDTDVASVRTIATAAHAAGVRVVQLWPSDREAERATLPGIIVARPFDRATLVAALGITAKMAPLVSQAA